MSTRLPTSTLSHLLQTVILICLLYLLGIVIARGLARFTACVTQKGSGLTARRSSSHPTEIGDHPNKKGDIDV